MMGRYLIEIALLNMNLLVFSPSKLAAAALFTAKSIVKEPTKWDEHMKEVTGYSE